MDTEGPLYNLPSALRLEGKPDVAALARGLGEIFRRHEVLRSAVRLEGEVPLARVQPVPASCLDILDLTALAGTERAEVEAKAVAQQFATTPFDLSEGPLMRALLVRLTAEEHWLLINFHHIAADGWSMGVFQRELSTLYDAYCRGESSPLPELAVQYADFAHWQHQNLRGEVLERLMTYWLNHLDGVPPLELPSDRPRPAVQDVRGGSIRAVMPRPLLDQLSALGRANGATLFMTLLAAVEVLFQRLSRQDDFAVGTPVAGRTRSEVEPSIGMFVNTLALRADVSGDPSFEALLTRTRTVVLGGYEHEDVPFEKLVAELSPERDLARSPFFQVLFALQSGLTDDIGMQGLEVSSVLIESPEAKYDLTLAAVEGEEGLTWVTGYATSLFDATWIHRLHHQLEVLLESIAEDPSQRISRLSWMSVEERHQVLQEWSFLGESKNGSITDFRDSTVHEQFALRAAESPRAAVGRRNLDLRRVGRAIQPPGQPPGGLGSGAGGCRWIGPGA